VAFTAYKLEKGDKQHSAYLLSSIYKYLP